MPFEYDPYSEDVKADPYPYYAKLREQPGIYRIPSSGHFAVARYDDVRDVLRAPDVYSSMGNRTMALSNALGGDPTTAGTPSQKLETAQVLKSLSELPINLGEILTARVPILSDPPEHTDVRNLVNRGFTPRRIAALEPRIRAITEELMASIRGHESFDLVQDLAIPLPVRVISEMLGIEPERQEDFKRWSTELLAGVTGSAISDGVASEQFLAAFGDYTEYVMDVIERRTRDPKDDLISVLVEARDGEARLTELEVLLFTLLLLLAGNETTTNLISNAVLALFENPDQLEQVVADRSSIPLLVEEAVRYDSPIQALYRVTTRDTELRGTAIPSGSIVMPLFASGNRDSAQFPEADRFDVRRNPQGHLGFGLGVHFCLGASLARLEARVALEAIVEALPRLRLVEQSPIPRIDSFLLRGLEHLRLAAV